LSARPSAKELFVARDFSTAGYAGLVMTQPSGAMHVGGSVAFNGARTQLSAGTLFVSGDFTQAGSGTFAAGGTHLVSIGPSTGQDQSVTFSDLTDSWFENLDVLVSPGRTVTVVSPVKVLGTLDISSTGGGTFALPAGLANQPNGPIVVHGTMTLRLGGTINASALTIGHGTVTVTGDGVLALISGALRFDDDLHLELNATGSLIGDMPVRCTSGRNVVIDGANGAAVASLKALCGVP
jgi:hypothetical protein